jgi:flagellum-specific ATP synthase
VEGLIERVGNLPRMTRLGRVARMEGLLVELTGAAGAIGLGGRLSISAADGAETPMAQREIGPSAGEPPAKGYTPTVFAELPRLLERVGPGHDGTTGSITGLFAVLVEGDDHNEAFSDAVRSTLDGHIILGRAIAERGRYPAVNVLKSLSRAMPRCNSEEEQDVVSRARAELAVYEDMAELIRLGAYKSGTNPEVDRAIALNGPLEAFLKQRKDERAGLASGYATLSKIVEGGTAKGKTR